MRAHLRAFEASVAPRQARRGDGPVPVRGCPFQLMWVTGQKDHRRPLAMIAVAWLGEVEVNGALAGALGLSPDV
jgi:hypothetical protein